MSLEKRELTQLTTFISIKKIMSITRRKKLFKRKLMKQPELSWRPQTPTTKLEKQPMLRVI